MLLEGMTSDNEGHLFGMIGGGAYVPLSCPQANAVIGKARWTSQIDSTVEGAKKRLKMRAKIDNERYYLICETNIKKGTQTDKTIYAIPYLTFFK